MEVSGGFVCSVALKCQTSGLLCKPGSLPASVSPSLLRFIFVFVTTLLEITHSHLKISISVKRSHHRETNSLGQPCVHSALSYGSSVKLSVIIQL